MSCQTAPHVSHIWWLYSVTNPVHTVLWECTVLVNTVWLGQHSKCYNCIVTVHYYVTWQLVQRLWLTFRNPASYIKDGHTATFNTPHFLYFLTNTRTEFKKVVSVFVKGAPTHRIVNGTDAAPGQFQFQVRISMRLNVLTSGEHSFEARCTDIW
jgi:hypothetical protein